MLAASACASSGSRAVRCLWWGAVWAVSPVGVAASDGTGGWVGVEVFGVAGEFAGIDFLVKGNAHSEECVEGGGGKGGVGAVVCVVEVEEVEE